MKVITLVENTKLNNELKCHHGLSLYIETKTHKILFDTGKNEDFIFNAKLLDVGLSEVDTVFISHGHYDHGGGLESFLKINEKAKIYIHKDAFGKFYAKRDNCEMEYIGLDENIKENQRIIFTQNDLVIDQELRIFMGVERKVLNPESNNSLYTIKEGKLVLDDFSHEQNLVINENGKQALICGCAHSGIVNILNNFREKYNEEPDYVVGGFHLYKYCLKPKIKEETVIKTAEYLKNTKTKYFTCHCTGKESFECLESIMGDRIQYLKTGTKIER